jgi:hypothetical protein
MMAKESLRKNWTEQSNIATMNVTKNNKSIIRIVTKR